MSVPDRLENLEVVVRALRAEVAELRAELGRHARHAPAAPAVHGDARADEQPAAYASAGAAAAAPNAFGARGAPPQLHDAASTPGVHHQIDAPRTASAQLPPAQLPPVRPAAHERPPHTATPAWPGPRPELESLVGRYGTLALGALALVMALGAWLSWAIENYEMSDAARVALGGVAAVAVGALGLWLRRQGATRQGTTRYGNVLLGIALALVHVDAWGAGPVLNVVPTSIALGFATLASAALAVLAYRGDEESLFVIGVGGALAAPFVTTDGRGNIVLLLLYGWLVLGGAIYALRGREWRWAHWLVVNGALAYAVVGAVRDPVAGAPWFLRDAPLFFALNVAATAWAAEPGGRRGLLARRLLYVALVPAFIYHDLPAAAADRVALAFAATVLGYLALRGAGDSGRALVDRVALPLLLLVAALTSVLANDAPPSVAGAGAALLWAAAALGPSLFGAASRTERGVELAVDLAVAGIASAAAIPIALGGDRVLAPVALALHAAAFSLVVRRERQLVVAVPVVLALAAAGTWSYLLLAMRPVYRYTPFATTASLAAAALVAASCVVSWLFTRRELRTALGLTERHAVLVGAVGPAAAFFWGNQELMYAVSPAVASFALIAYWATAGVSAILVGRGHGIPAARQAGLALSILAAVKAVGQASDEQSIGLRIGSYLLVGVFLLAVAYWYRAAGSEAPPAADEPRPA